MVANDHDGWFSGCAYVEFCRVAHYRLAREEVEGVSGGDIKNGEATGVTAMTGSDVFLRVPCNDSMIVGCGPTPRSPQALPEWVMCVVLLWGDGTTRQNVRMEEPPRVAHVWGLQCCLFLAAATSGRDMCYKKFDSHIWQLEYRRSNFDCT